MMTLKITKHGRERFHERVGFMTDEDITTFVMFPQPDYTFIWRVEMIKKKFYKCLITVLLRR